MITLRSYSEFSSGAVFQQHASTNKPIGLAVGDLMLFSVAMAESITGYGAWTDSTSAAALFSDLLVDDGGYGPLQHGLGGGGAAPAWTWWLGWRWADASDVAASTYTIDIRSGIFGGFGPVGAGDTHLVLLAFTGFDPTTPFGDANDVANYPGSPPILLPSVVSNEGQTVTEKYLTTTGGGIGSRGVWAAITNAADGTEELFVATEAVDNATTLTAGAGMVDIIERQQTPSSFWMGRGDVKMADVWLTAPLHHAYHDPY